MLKTLLGAFALAAMLISAGAAPAQTMFRPVAVVNDSAITGFDLAQRAQILVVLGIRTDNKEVLRNEALDRLIEDRLKVQEAKRMGITASQETIDEGIAGIAQRVNVSPDEFRAAMNAHGVAPQSLNDMVAADAVWGQVVRGRFARRVDPGEAEIDAEIALMQQRTAASYRLAEIGLPFGDRGRSEADTRALAQKLYVSLSQGGDFDAAVRQYSRSPSAAKGGEIGWVPSQRLPPALVDMLGELEVGQVGRPIPVKGGLSILKLMETRADGQSAIDKNDPELRKQIRERLSSERIQRLAEGLLQELRRDALIELR